MNESAIPPSLPSSDGEVRVATHTGVLQFAGVKVPCAVLEDGQRIVSEVGITNVVLGSRSGASKRLKKSAQEAGALLPIFLAPNVLKPFIDKYLDAGALTPIAFRLPKGKAISYGYQAELLPKVCEVWLSAREAGVLQTQQLDKAQRAEILMRSLAHIGILSLVDEATGYQEIRDKKALAAILDKFLRKEYAAWAKTFPDDFYIEMFRLRGWQWKGMQVNRPSVVGLYTNDLVYDRLAPRLRKELEHLNPKVEGGERKQKHHQWLTGEVGHPALARHLYAVIGFMRAAGNWGQFYRNMQRAYPKFGETMPIDFGEDF